MITTEVVHIVLVEDDQRQAEFIAGAFDKNSYKVTCFYDGLEAFRYLSENTDAYDVVLLDYRLPSMNGIEVIQNLKAKGIQAGIIFLTAFRTIDIVLKAMKEGALDFIPKTRNIYQDLPEMVQKVYQIQQDRLKRKQFEKELAESEIKLRTFMDTASDLMYIKNNDGRFTYVNKAMCDTLEYTRDELTGMHIKDVIFQKTEDFAAFQQRFLTRLHRYGEISEEMIWQSKSKKKIYGELKAVAEFDASNKIVNCKGVFRNITERKQAEEILRESEEKFRQLAENIKDVFWLRTKNGRLLYISPAFEEIWGQPCEKLYHNDELFYQGIHPEDRLQVQQVLSDENFTSTGKYNMEFRVIHPDDYIRWIWARSFPVYDNTGKLIKTAGIAKDITERKKAEGILQKNQKRLKELNATKDKFFSIIAHDLKTPFSTLLTLSELIINRIDKYDTEELKNLLKLIHEAASVGYTLLDNLLIWSRSQTGKIQLHLQYFQINEIIFDTISLQQTAAKNKQIKLYFDEDANENKQKVFADKNMIMTVLRNLVSNAIKFTKPGGRVVISKKRITENNQKYLQITVADTGVGIQKEDIQKIFRIDLSHSTPGTANEQGTGLGLLLCKEFVEKNSGKIWVESEVNKGTKFYFTLPCCK